MRNISSAFSRALANDKRDYQSRLVITLADNTVLNANNTQIWDGGLKIEDAVSGDNVFQVGAAIINQGTFIINNIYGDFSEYAFDGAKVVAYTGLTNLDDNTDEEIKLGTYIVDETNYNGSLITLTCVDNMSKFDKAYDTNLSYPTTLFTIVSDACTKCGVILSNSSLNFPHKDYIVTTKPSSENTTFRQVISWAAQIACCYARCNSDGYLEIKWYDTDEFDNMSSWLDGGVFDQASGSYETGDDADGGSFNPWSIGDVYDGGLFTDRRSIHFIMSSYSSNIATDNVVITGVKVIKKINGDGSSDAFEEYTSGTAGYIIVIENNEFIDGVHGQDVANWIGEQLNGLSFRKAEITHPSNPSIEAGDVGIYFDTRDNYYPIVISSTEFIPGNSQRTSSSAETPRKNSAQRFSEATRNYVEIRKRLSQQKTEWEEAEEELNDRIDNAGGLYCTEVTEGTATKIYYHNKPILEESDIRMLFSDVGFTLTSDGGETWYGMTVDGTMIAAILQVYGINADWIRTGTISIGGVTGNRNGSLIIKDENGNVIAEFSKNGVSVKGNIQSGSTISGANINGGEINGANVYGTVLYGSQIVLDEDHSNRYFSGMKIYSYNFPDYVNYVIGTEGIASLFSDSFHYNPNWEYSNVAQISSGTLYVTRGFYDDRLQYIAMSSFGLSIDFDIDTYYADDYDSIKVVYAGDNGSTWNHTNIARIGFKKNGTYYPYCLFEEGILYANNLTVFYTKSRAVETSYGTRLAYCYEMPSPMFGDIGGAIIGEDGLVLVEIDPIFQDYIYGNGEYYVFLQNEGRGESYIAEKTPEYFVISGTPGLKVAWEIKAKQVDAHWLRSEEMADASGVQNGEPDYIEDAFKEVMDYLNGGTE